MRRGRVKRMSTSQRAGVVAASASVPRSLVPLLQPRSALDQGLITGLSAAAHYSVTTVSQEMVRGVSRGLLKGTGGEGDPVSTARMALAVNFTALGLASAVYSSLPYRKNESLGRALARAIAYQAVTATAAGLVAGVLEELPGQNRPIGALVRSAPVAITVGAGVSGAVQHLRSKPPPSAGPQRRRSDRPPLAKSVAIGAATAAGAVALASVERHAAHGIGAGISKASKGRSRGAIVSHLMSLGVIGSAIYGVGLKFFHRAEKAISTPDAVLAESPESPRVSGGTGSLIAWDPLTREVRRHLAGATSAERITEVMGEPALDPIRVYIGLTSATTVDERVRLALEEIERTGALDRSLLVLCSPTGSGYINHAASAAWEYLSRGDCASVALQYSSRPSWLSLDRVGEGREQNRALWTALAAALAERDPERRPRVVIFGESLGAHTSQDAFLHTGTRGIRELGIDRALWFGIPHVSRWAIEVSDPSNPDVLPGELLRVAAADDLDILDRSTSPVRYILISHIDDAVTLFSPALLVEHPWWLGDKRPASVPLTASYSSPTTFLQAAVDVKNVQTVAPGTFGSAGHDYRGDAARAVRFAFDLPCSDIQMAAIEAALREEEVGRVSRWARAAYPRRADESARRSRRRVTGAEERPGSTGQGGG